MENNYPSQPATICSANDPILEMLTTQRNTAVNSAEVMLEQLQQAVEKVKGCTYWLNRNLDVAKWCERTIREIESFREAIR